MWRSCARGGSLGPWKEEQEREREKRRRELFYLWTTTLRCNVNFCVWKFLLLSMDEWQVIVVPMNYRFIGVITTITTAAAAHRYYTPIG